MTASAGEYAAAPQVASQVGSYNGSRFELDYVSTGCLQCHSGDSRGTQVSVAWGSAVSLTQHTNHPVGMDYADYAWQAPGGYESVHQVKNVLPLVNGKVSCISCHALKDNNIVPMGTISTDTASLSGCYASDVLTLPPPSHNLCQSCHIK